MPTHSLPTSRLAHIPLHLSDSLYIISDDRTIARTDDEFQTVTSSQDGFRNFGNPINSMVFQSGKALCVVDYNSIGFCTSVDKAKSWTRDVILPGNLRFDVKGQALLHRLILFSSDSILSSIDGALTWTRVPSSQIPTTDFNGFFPAYNSGIELYFYAQYKGANPSDRRYYRLDTAGVIHDWIFDNPNASGYNGLIVLGDTLLSLNPSSSLMLSYNHGGSWKEVHCADTTITLVFASLGVMTQLNGTVFVSCNATRNGVHLENYPIFRLVDSALVLVESLSNLGFGTTFSDAPNFNHSFFSADKNIVFAFSGGVYESTNGGADFHTSYMAALPDSVPIVSALKVGTTTYALLDGLGLYVNDSSSDVETHDSSNDATSNSNLMSVKPLPAVDMITIVYDNTINKPFCVYNLLSQKLLEGIVKGPIDIHSLPTGIYILQCDNQVCSFFKE